MTYFNRDAYLNLSSVTGNINKTGNYSVVSRSLSLEPELLGGDFWVSKSVLNSRSYPAAFSLGGYIYAANGNTGGGSTSLTEQFNDNTNAWATKALTPVVKSYSVGCTLNGLGYSFGGYTTGGTTTAAFSYNEIANSWVSIPPTLTTRYYSAGYALNGFIYSIAGIENVVTGTPNTANEQYSQALNVWTGLTALPTAKSGPAGFVLSGIGYIVCGGTGAGTTPSSTNYQYNDATGTWLTKSSATNSRYENGAFSLNGFGYSIGGNNGSGVQQTSEEYNDVVDSWKTKSNMPAIRQDQSGVNLNGFGYAVAGTFPGPTNSMYQYRNHTLYKIPTIFKKSFNQPKRILVATSLQEDNYTVPIQIRTDGSTWNYMESNHDSLVKTGSSTSATLSPSSGVGEYVYEIQVGLPDYVAGVGGGVWLTKAFALNSYSGRGGFTDGGYGFLACGVDSASAAQGGTEQYNDDTNVWSSKTATGSVSEGPAGYTLRGMGYCYGGNNAGSGNNLTRQHNSDTDSWTNRSNSTAFNYPSAMAINGFGYVGAPANTTTHAATNNLNQYNYDTNTYITRATVPSNRSDAAMASINGFGYCFGGDNSGTKANSNFLYNDSANTWTTKGTITTAKSAHAAFVIKGTIFSCGGATAVTDGSVTNEALQYYDTLDTWYTRSTAGTARASLKAFAFNGYGYISSGYTSNLSTKTTETNQYIVNDRIPVLTVTLRVEE